MRRSGINVLVLVQVISLAALVFTGAARPLQAFGLSYERIVRLSLVSGDVQVSRPGQSGWAPAVQNMPVVQGVTIGTNDGRAEVQFEDGTTAWIAGDTLVQFTEMALSNGGRISKLTLAQGTVSIYATLKRGDVFTVTTPRELITVPKLSLFRVDAFHHGASISVFQGNVQITSSAGTKLLGKGQTFGYKGNHLADAAITSNPAPDAWDRWIHRREQVTQVETAQALSYADAPFTYGMADLSEYGGWNYFPGYGYGWQPFGMEAGWAPFSAGEWDSYPGLGWTWISYEPWGWVPYHFGDWLFSPVYGWMWLPNGFGFWDPAPVNWYAMGNRIGWAPIAPSNQRHGMGSGARYPVAPRTVIVSDSKEIGRPSGVRIITVGGVGAQFRALPGEPLENGKVPRFGDAVRAVNHGAPAQLSRAFVPTAPDMAHLQKSMLATNGRIPAMKMNMRLPAAPAPQAFHVENAMRMPTAMPRRPARMYFPQAPSPLGMNRSAGFSAAGESSPGFSPPGYSGPSFSAPRMSPMPAAPAARASSGKPH